MEKKINSWHVVESTMCKENRFIVLDQIIWLSIFWNVFYTKTIYIPAFTKIGSNASFLLLFFFREFMNVKKLKSTNENSHIMNTCTKQQNITSFQHFDSLILSYEHMLTSFLYSNKITRKQQCKQHNESFHEAKTMGFEPMSHIKLKRSV